MPWDPFLMKKLLKSGICGLVSSAWVHCSRFTSSNSAVGTKKKKSENTNTATYNSNPNTYIVPIWIQRFPLNPKVRFSFFFFFFVSHVIGDKGYCSYTVHEQ